MKMASVRELRQDFPRILAWLQAGEEVAITFRREAIARLVPYKPKRAIHRPMPDVGARLRKVFGRRVIPDKTVKALLEGDRGGW